MALEKQKINIAFAQGVDTKSDPKQVIPGKLLTLENGVFQKTNSIIKRNGYAALSTSMIDGSSVSAAVGISTFKDELFLLANGNSYSFSPSLNKWSKSKGSYVPLNINRSSVGVSYGNGSPYSAIDTWLDTTNNLQFCLFTKLRTGNDLYYSVKDLTTNTFIVNDIQLGSGTLSSVKQYFRVVKMGSDFVVIFDATYSGTSALYYIKINTSTLTTQSTPVAIATRGTSVGDYKTETPFDAIVSNGIIHLSYADGAANTLYLVTISPSYVIFGSSVLGVDALYGSCLFADASNNIWIGANSGTTVNALGYTNAFASSIFSAVSIGTGSTLRNIVGIIDPVLPARGYFYWTDANVSGSNIYTNPNKVRVNYVDYSGGTGTAGTAADVLGNASLFSKPFNYNSKKHLIVNCYDTSNFYSYYLIDVESTVVCEGKLLNQSANALWGNTVPVYAVSSATFTTLLVELNSDSESYIVYTYNLSYDHKPIFAEIANNLHITGGFIYMYDGKQVCEHSFLVNPTTASVTGATGSGSVAAGDYYYKYTYEWVDAYGQLHISAPSNPSVKVTLGATGTLTVVIPTLQLTNRQDQIFIGLYRSSDGINFYKYLNSGYNGEIKNSTTANTVTFSDIYAFATYYQGQPLLYTDSNEVANIDPGAVTYLATYNQRLIAIPAENQNTWWYSKEVIPSAPGNAGTPIYFSDSFISTVDERAGGINGVLQLDEKLLFFKRNNIFALAGNGPAVDGSGNDFNPPQVIATDTGCIEGQSIVLGPSGIMFKSAKGIYLIDRSLSVSYIGAPVEAFNTYEVLSADLIYNLNQFRFGLSNGQALVYNYLFDQWSVFTNHAIVQACIYQNKYTFAKSTAVCWQENSGYLDDTTPISLKLTTSWLSFADLQGFQRVYKLMLLGKWKSSHYLTVQVSHDFDDTVFQTTNINVLTTDPYEYRLFLTRQKCTAVKFTIFDAATLPTVLNEGYEISAMAFEVGIKRGLNKLAATRSAG